MKHIITAGLIVLACVGISHTIVRAYPIQPVGVCYAVDGTNIETTYINAAAAYPIASSGTVEQTETGFAVTHRTVFERLQHKVFAPGVMK